MIESGLQRVYNFSIRPTDSKITADKGFVKTNN